ncbi:MAG: histidinol-phosphate transaminase [Candidatus Bathyarchaeota archaeon]|nr:histidinol-phosphate transaminase [Candidatus Bathyarchaeota archaeon]
MPSRKEWGGLRVKPTLDLANESFRNLKPCVHGADVLEAADKTGRSREDILDFSSSVNPLGPSEKALQAVTAGFGQIPSYPDSCATALREAIASHYTGVTKDNVIVGNGSTELIYLFAEAFMHKGDVALIPAPSFGEYEGAVRKTGQKVRYVKLGKKFQADPERFARAMTGKTKIVYFCNPNNPTSILTPPEKLAQIIQAALDKDTLVFLDEDFLEFVDEGEKLSMINRIKEFPNLFILRSFTKIFGLTGLRIGYGIASEDVVSLLMNAKLPWNVNCLGQAAAVAALNDQEHLQKTLDLIKVEKTFLLGKLKRLRGLKIYAPDANFIFMDTRKTGFTATQLKQKMLSQSVLIRDCTSFAGLDEYYVRVAVKTRQENERLLAAFKQSLDKQV